MSVPDKKKPKVMGKDLAEHFDKTHNWGIYSEEFMGQTLYCSAGRDEYVTRDEIFHILMDLLNENFPGQTNGCTRV